MKNIIKKILKEENIKQSLKQQVKDYGIKDAAELVDGIGNFLSLMNFESPMEFLHLFDNLNVIQSENDPNLLLFRYKPKENIIVYDRKFGVIYINYDEILSVLENHFGLTYPETRPLIKKWLSEVYNLSLEKTFMSPMSSRRLVE